MKPIHGGTVGAVILAALGLAGALCAASLIVAGDRTRTGGNGKKSGGPLRVVQGFQKEITPEDWPANPDPRRVMVSLNTAIDEAIVTELASHGVIHGWVDRYRFVAMTPKDEENRAAVAALSYVRSVDNDAPAHLTTVGTWDLDIIDAVDVEESGVPGNPDHREVAETGAGVHVAIIDTGLVNEWRDFLREERVDTRLARAFLGNTGITSPPDNQFNAQSGAWEQDQCRDGLGVAGMVIGSKWIEEIEGVAPGVKIIPLKVFGNDCGSFLSNIVGAVEYCIRLVESGAVNRLVVNLGFEFRDPQPPLEAAINDAIAAGVIVVASGGNAGESGMGWPGAYHQVISTGAVAWTKQFRPGTLTSPNFAFWWTQDVLFDPDPRRPPQEDSDVFIPAFSSRAIASRGQELDVVAPGQNLVVPFGTIPGSPGTLIWTFTGGTSFASPLTAGVAALMLERNPSLRQADIEAIIKSSALPMSPVDSRSGILFFFAGFEGSISWDDFCETAGAPCDPVGAGLLQADSALAATPRPDRK